MLKRQVQPEQLSAEEYQLTYNHLGSLVITFDNCPVAIPTDPFELDELEVKVQRSLQRQLNDPSLIVTLLKQDPQGVGCLSVLESEKSAAPS